MRDRNISAGLGHSLHLNEDGTVWAWGSNRPPRRFARLRSLLARSLRFWAEWLEPTVPVRMEAFIDGEAIYRRMERLAIRDRRANASRR